MLRFDCEIVSETALLVRITIQNAEDFDSHKNTEQLSYIAKTASQLLHHFFRSESFFEKAELASAFDSVLIDFPHSVVPIEEHYARCYMMLNQSAKKIEDLSRQYLTQPSQNIIEVPVHYDLDNKYDLDEIASQLLISKEEIIERHSETKYKVLCLGFSPGFAFLGNLSRDIQLPRRKIPRTKVPKGAVAIANQFTAIYPTEGPGGWHIIGTTDIELMSFSDGKPELLLSQGDHIKFAAV